MQQVEQVRTVGAQMLREIVQERRKSERALSRCSQDLTRLVLAGVEGLEMLGDTIEAFGGELTASSRDAVQVATQAAWERLRAAGVGLDGTVGEPVDLVRHRVARTRPVGTEGAPAAVVLAVMSPGITFAGARVREAVVCASRGEDDDAPDRD